jgi:hypothetical protein
VIWVYAKAGERKVTVKESGRWRSGRRQEADVSKSIISVSARMANVGTVPVTKPSGNRKKKKRGEITDGLDAPLLASPCALLVV